MKWWQPSPSSEIKPVPWLSPAVIQHLENLVQPDWTILEHGSGGSTLWFAARCKFVAAYENNLDWYAIMQDHLKGKSNHSLSPLGSRPPTGAAEYIDFDLLLIDGEPVEDRCKWIAAAPQLVKPGGWVVLDNANRPEYAKERQHLQAYAAEFQTFDGNEGGTKYLVTEFYRMPEAVIEPMKKETKRARRSKS
jgi:predicted O-methyltransferase YrrM